MHKIRSLFFLTVTLMLSIGMAHSEKINNTEKKVVINFIDLVKNNEREILSNIIRYPLKRRTPLLDIKNKKEFFERYSEVFDAELINMITSSNPDSDWASVGWRGVMLNQGALWLNRNGDLIAVNYQSKIEKTKSNELEQLDRATVHPSLNSFVRSVFEWKTSKHHIRIDEMEKHKYRYAVWPLNSSTQLQPDLILYNGIRKFYGSGGNHSYEFKNGKYIYICYINHVGASDTPPIEVKVYKENKLVLSEAVVEVILD